MAEVRDPRKNAPACPRCQSPEGHRWCYTATGFARHMHTERLNLIAGRPAAEPKDPDSLAGKRPSRLQSDILAAAVASGGQYEVSGYRFRGDAQRRSAMAAMADPARGWFEHLTETQHGTLYEITDAGRAAHNRYLTWMNGGPK